MDIVIGHDSIVGRHVRPEQVGSPPRIRIKQKKLYSLIMFDPDASGGTKIHWLVVNIGSKHQTEAVPYLGPHPPKGTGNHRYICWVMEQKRIIRCPHVESRYSSFSNLFDRNEVVAKSWFYSSH